MEFLIGRSHFVIKHSSNFPNLLPNVYYGWFLLKMLRKNLRKCFKDKWENLNGEIWYFFYFFFIFSSKTGYILKFDPFCWHMLNQSSWVSMCISGTKSKQQSPCSNYMHRPVTSWGNACIGLWGSTYCMRSKVSSNLYSSYYDDKQWPPTDKR